ncbi:LysR family transcriptional regulator substrate-binding protein [Oceanobacillus luteolus]|uniref:LysR family transcriptional regulator substrate-binding protein n=1 Tax=Oceanobacillus luteolus TaxID=1274358 RepID=A0ABW4HU76_9BACI
MEALSTEPFILLDQGDWSEPLESFKANGLQPNIEYRVIDDYTIMSMVESGLGISILSELVLNKVSYRFVKKETAPPIYRTIGIAYKTRKLCQPQAGILLILLSIGLMKFDRWYITFKN